MPSDGDTKESAKKRVIMSAKDKDMDKKLDELKKKPRDAAATNEESDGAAAVAPVFEDGMKVNVRSATNDKELLAATVVRVHRSGELSVKYEETGETEKYVNTSRVQRSLAPNAEKTPAFEEGDAVLYQKTTKGAGDEVSWREGTVETCRKDGSYDIVDAESDELIKKVLKEAVKKAKRKPKTKSKPRKDQSVASVSDGDESEEKILLATDAPIEYKNKKGIWYLGRVHKVHSDGTFDVVNESDDETVVKRVKRKHIRRAKKKSKAKAGNSEKGSSKGDGNNDEDSSVRKRRTLSKMSSKKSKREKLQDDDDNENDGGEGDTNSETPPSRGKGVSRAGGNTLFAQMRVNHIVQFPGKNGRMHRGRIKLLRKDDDTCDIEHESDTEVVSKRIPIDDVRLVSAFSRLMGRPTWMNQDPRVFQLNARVLYRTKDGAERKAVVVKLWRDTSKDVGPVYDIEDIFDGNVLKKVPGSKLRPVPWLNYSLPQMPGFNFNTSLFSTIPRKGMKVRFRRRSGESGRLVWEDGVIVRAKSDGICLIEYTNSKGSKEQAQVKNGDIQTRFLSPFSNPLKDFMPNIELPKSMYAAGSFVEVSSGSKVFLGSVMSSNEQERTYVITYNDGRKEKNVSADRVRLSLRKLRIGTEVEMIVEGPCKEVSKLDGEVAWVHRDERVAIRINGGNNDVFAQVCSHALMVDGKPAFAAPLSSTWLETIGFYLNLTIELLIYAWLCFGMIVEMGEMIQLFSDTASDQLEDKDFMTEFYANREVNWSSCEFAPPRNSSSSSAPYLLIPKQVLETDRAWLVVLLALKALLTAGCAVLGARLVHSKIMAIQDNYIDVREHQLDQVRRRHLGRVMGGAVVVSYLTMTVYASLLNRFEYYCLLQDAATSIRFDDLALKINMFSVHTEYATVVDLVLQLAAKTTMNLFRAMALHSLIFAFPVSNTAFVKRVLLLLPSIGLAALICAMSVAALHVFYYVQKTEVVTKQILMMTTRNTDWGIVLVAVTVWLDASIFNVVAAGGRYFETLNERAANSRGDVTDDVLDQAERGEFGLQAKREVLLTKVEQLQEQLGVCKLSVVRIHSHVIVHLLAVTLGIYANCSLRDSVEQQQHHSSSSSNAVLKSMTFHLVICILWLVTTVFASLYALTIKQEPRIGLPLDQFALQRISAMTSVLQSVKQEQLTDLEERESRAAFQIVTNGCVEGEISARQLKVCLRALGFPMTSSAEAAAFVYEFDYKSTHTIALADFQRIYLFKARQRSRQMIFDEAFEALDGDRGGSIRLKDLRCDALSSIANDENGISTLSKSRHSSRIDEKALVKCAALQYYYDEDSSQSAIDGFVYGEYGSDAAARISRDALGAFLRIRKTRELL